MSEVEYMLGRFRAAIDSEYRLSGHRPTVAVIGSLDYDALMGCILTTYYARPTSPPAQIGSRFGKPTFEGIELFKSHSFTTGIFVGWSDQ